MTQKLIYEATKVSVKLNDVIHNPTLGDLIVKNIRAPRKHSGTGRVTVMNSAGKKMDYAPSIINAIWI